jgi:acyl-coenzyme A thioesterase PaaI-like protein
MFASTSSRLLRPLARPARAVRAHAYATAPAAAARSSVATPRYVLRTLAGGAALAGSFYALGALYPPDVVTLLYPRPGAPIPDAHTPEALAYTTGLEATLHALPALVAHRARPDAGEWYETRPYANTPPERLRHSLSAGALRGPGRLALPPLVRAKRDESEAVVFVHLGRGLCGHEGIIHGGLLATLLDEALGRLVSNLCWTMVSRAQRLAAQAILNFTENIAVTANLHLNYRAPTRADQFVMIKTRIVERAGRKITVAGAIETLDGTPLVEATYVPSLTKSLSPQPVLPICKPYFLPFILIHTCCSFRLSFVA